LFVSYPNNLISFIFIFAALAKLKSLPRSKLVLNAKPIQSNLASADESSTTIPEGVTPSFYSLYQAYLSDLETTQPDKSGLRILAYEVKTVADAELFKNALFRWRRHTPQLPYDQADILIVVDALLTARAHSTLLEIACDRKRYSVFLSEEQLLILMQRFREEVEATSVLGKDGAAEEGQIETLNNLYKSFALLLYSHIAPTSEAYSLLITAGVYGGTAEGWRRSVITAKEQISLGLPLLGESADALVAGYLRASDVASAAQYLRKDVIAVANGQPPKALSSSKESLLLAAKVWIKSGEFEKAVATLEYIAGGNVGESKPYGWAFWPSASSIVGELKEALGEGNEALVGRVEEAVNKIK
jgi:hypothetical protein